MRLTAILPCLIGAALSGCAALAPQRPHASVEVVRPDPKVVRWQDIATAPDAARIDALAARWTTALASIPARLRPVTPRERALIDPAAAQPLPALPPGSYHCRLVKLGGKPALLSLKPDFCYVDIDADKIAFTKQTGASLPGGFVYPDGDKRLVLLATNRAPGAATAAAYGVDQARNMVGVIERIGPFRWRLTMPRGDGAQLDVYDLTPTPDQPE